MMTTMEAKERLIVAIDRADRGEILELVEELRDVTGMVKLGLQAFVANGPSLVREVRDRGLRVFLDLKFHDIPNTAAEAVRAAASLDVQMLTLHAAGGEAMMRTAASAGGDGMILLGVTILTSLADEDIATIGWKLRVDETVLRLAAHARGAGLGGVVASPLEIAAIRRECGEAFLIVTPGIRSERDPASDQKRAMTAAEAIRTGADYLVVGRPITSSARPRDAAARLVDEMAAAQ